MSNHDLAKKAAYASVIKKLKAGKSLTAADYKVIDNHDRESWPAEADDEVNFGATLEEDLEDWALRDRAVRGRVRKLSELASLHQAKPKDMERMLLKIQRRLLVDAGFEAIKGGGRLSASEITAFNWVKSLHQIESMNADWWIVKERSRGSPLSAEALADLAKTMASLIRRRDQLIFKIRELAIKESKTGTNRNRPDHIEIVIGD